MSRRVVVTGLGVITPAGCRVSEFWTNIIEGVSCITKLTYDQHEGIPSKVAALVSNDILTTLKAQEKIPAYKSKILSRSTLFALLAARQAVHDSNLQNCNTHTKDRIGVAIGSGMSDFADIYEMKQNLDSSYNRVSAYFIPRILLNMSSGNISKDYGFRGPNHCVTTACATGTHAIGDSFKMIQNGQAIAMVCGGTEACINPLTIAGFSRLRGLSCNFNDRPTEASRPFDEKRDGFVIGEGAAVLVLEGLEHALSRNASIYAEILGYGMSGDAFSLTTPSENGEGAILSMQRCLEDIETIKSDYVSYVNAHATSTPVGDETELKAISQVFRNSSQSIYVSSLKGCYGHLLGAAGSVECVGTVLACYHGWIPPTVNLENCCNHDKKILCNTKKVEWKKVSRRIALKNSFGFGGTNATLCLAEFQR